MSGPFDVVRESIAAQLELYRRQFEKIKREVTELAAGMSDAQFNWRPPAGGWSVGECLSHLNITNAQYLAPLDDAIAEARAQKRLGRGPFKHGMLGKYFIKFMEPPPRWRLRSPRKLAPERKAHRVAVVVPTFLTFQDQLIERVVAANGVDLWRAKVTSQASRLIRFSLGETYAILAAHERRHLWQASQVVKAPGFPADHGKD
ncbi:MAG: DinB family protein [Gemmatimonadaceae bacterium]